MWLTIRHLVPSVKPRPAGLSRRRYSPILARVVYPDTGPQTIARVSLSRPYRSRESRILCCQNQSIPSSCCQRAHLKQQLPANALIRAAKPGQQFFAAVSGSCIAAHASASTRYCQLSDTSAFINIVWPIVKRNISSAVSVHALRGF